MLGRGCRCSQVCSGSAGERARLQDCRNLFETEPVLKMQPLDMLLDDVRVGAIVAAADALHVRRLQQWHGFCKLERHGIRTEPRLVF